MWNSSVSGKFAASVRILRAAQFSALSQNAQSDGMLCVAWKLVGTCEYLWRTTRMLLSAEQLFALTTRPQSDRNQGTLKMFPNRRLPNSQWMCLWTNQRRTIFAPVKCLGMGLRS